jgi:hypothetical protein
MLKTDLGRTALEGLIPILIILAADHPMSDKLPPAMKENILRAANFAFDSFTQNAAGKVTEEAFALLLPLFQDYMKAGESMALAESAQSAVEDLLGPGTREAVKAL